MRFFTSICQRLSMSTCTKGGYSTLVYPTRGQAVLIHDGLGIAEEYPWYHRLITQPSSTAIRHCTAQSTSQPSSDEIHGCDRRNLNELGENVLIGTGIWQEDSCWDYESEGSSINPASGLPIMGGVDVAGNPYGSGSFFSDPFPFSSSGF